MTTDTDTAAVYLVTLNRPASGRFEWGAEAGESADSRTFYAMDSRYYMVCLIVPGSDPRHVGMWATNTSEHVGLDPMWSEGTTLYGWHVQREALESITPLADAPTAPAEPVSEFTHTTFGEIPVGTEWSNRDLWNAQHWVKVSPTQYIALVQNGESYPPRSSLPYYPVTIRNTAHVPTDDNSEEVARLRVRLDRQAREFEQWKQHATETAHEYAQNNSLCSEFDRCMVAIGLEPRDSYTEDHDVTVTITYRFSVDVPPGTNVEEYVHLNGGFEEFDSEPDVDWDVD